jgi:hypothetical protein
MALFQKETNINPYFYIYGNQSYENEIKNYLMAHFQDVFDLNLSSSSGCGFKILSYDSAKINELDTFLESCEGWIQKTRRNEFSDFDSNFLNLDKFVSGCNNRITTDRIDDLNFLLNAHKGTIVLRTFSLLGGINPGTYKIYFGSDTINGSVPANASITDNRTIKKTIPTVAGLTNSFFMQLTNCTFSGGIAEFSGKNDMKNWTLGNPFIPDIAPGNTADENVSNFIDFPYDNYPRSVIHSIIPKKILKYVIYFEIHGVSGDTFKFDSSWMGGINSLSGATYPFISGYNAVSGQTFDFAGNPMNAFPENQKQIIEIDCNFPEVNILNIAFQSVQHPFPAVPNPVPVFRVYEIFVKTE